jgi:hypothetical protein
MSPYRAFALRFFEPPGQPPCAGAPLADAAAACHCRLLHRALGRDPLRTRDTVRALLASVVEQSSSGEARSILNHPLLIDALHALAAEDLDLRAWDDATAPRGDNALAESSAGHGREKLNNVALSVLLRRFPSWRGRIDLCTDAMGFLRFPASAWSLWLRSARAGELEPLANTVVAVAFEPRLVRWALADDLDDPFMIVARPDCLRLTVGSDPQLSRDRFVFPSSTIRPRLIHAPPLGDSHVRFEPAAFADSSFIRHAGLTGAIIQALLDAIHANAPGIHGELDLYLTAIRGHELPTGSNHAIASFSTPNLPGVMNLNIAYSADDEPLLSPFCFTWLGHELGHTKHYLIDDAAYDAGWRFVRNPGDRTRLIPRYGRPLGVRTVFQIPYVHLYELALLTSFMKKQFAGLPWDVAEDPVAFGDEIVAEINDSFALIEESADVTALGREALSHIHWLFDRSLACWNEVRA